MEMTSGKCVYAGDTRTEKSERAKENDVFRPRLIISDVSSELYGF